MIKIYLFRFRLACERINYLLLDVKGTPLKRIRHKSFNKSYLLKKEYAERCRINTYVKGNPTILCRCRFIPGAEIVEIVSKFDTFFSLCRFLGLPYERRNFYICKLKIWWRWEGRSTGKEQNRIKMEDRLRLRQN